MLKGRALLAKRNFTTLAEITNPKLKSWIQETAALCKPVDIKVCDGSEEESQELQKLLVDTGVFKPLNPKRRPNSFLVRTDPADVARSEKDTFICSKNQGDAGPTNNWVDPNEMKQKLQGLFKGCMEGRSMYVIPFSMGPLDSKLAVTGVQITDSPYVAASMNIMTRMGVPVLKKLADSDKFFVKCLHSVGYPLSNGKKDVPWPCNIKNRTVCHFPDTKEIISYGSGYGGNSLLGKKALALRIASVMGKEQGWLAEHMLILGLTSPEGKKHYIAAAFPSACGKTNLAMMQPTLKGWKVECVGDDIAWLKFNEQDGKLYAINPENGFFGVAPGTSSQSNPHALASLNKNSVFTNVAYLEKENDVWWEGLTKEPPFDSGITDWTGKKYDKEAFSKGVKAAHPNSRFTAPLDQCPIVNKTTINDPKGVPISAILFGGRRKTLVPLVFEPFTWNHGVLVGSSVASEITAAAEGSVGNLRFDPFAMLPFCGYNMADYFQHWVDMGKQSGKVKKQLPKFFHVNWFRKNDNDKFLWPGFGDNSRVLKWIVDRIEGKTDVAVKSPIGYIPKKGALDVSGLSIPEADLNELLKVDHKKYSAELEKVKQYHKTFGPKFPKELSKELDDLAARLKSS